MEAKPKKTLRTSLLIAIPFAVFATALAFLSLLHTPYATWLQVEAPAYAVAGSPLDVRITLGQVPEPSVLVVGLYTLEKSHRAISSQHSSAPSPSVRSGGTYSFRIDVKEAEKLALVQLVIYISPTGDWRTRTQAANSEAIPVKISGSRAGSPVLRKTRAFVLSKPRNPDVPFRPGGGPRERTFVPRSSAVFRMALLGLLAAGGLVCLLRSAGPRPGASQRSVKGRLFWRSAAILLFLGILWEIFRLEERLSEWGRRTVSGLDLYYFRQSYQKAAIALLAAGAAAVLVISFRAVARNRARLYPVLAGIALAGYTGLSLAAALSFHYIDVLKGISLAGATLVDAAKAACAAAVLAIGCFAFWADKR
jgi:hypothetical protein